MLLSTSSKHTITTFPLPSNTVLQSHSSLDPTMHSSWFIMLSSVLENLPVLSTQLSLPWPLQLLDPSQLLHLPRIYSSYKIGNRDIMDSMVTIVNNTITKQKIIINLLSTCHVPAILSARDTILNEKDTFPPTLFLHAFLPLITPPISFTWQLPIPLKLNSCFLPRFFLWPDQYSDNTPLS